MKKCTLIMFCICLTSLASCKAQVDHNFVLKASVYNISENNVANLHFYLSRNIEGYFEDDPQTGIYYGDSIYSYQIRKDDNVIVSYNVDDVEKTDNNKKYVNLDCPLWMRIEDYDKSILLQEVGSYTLDVEASFIYTYSGKQHTYAKSIDFEVKEITTNMTYEICDDFSFTFKTGYTEYDSKTGVYTDTTGSYNVSLSQKEFEEAYDSLRAANAYKASSEIYFKEVETEPFYEKMDLWFSYTANGLSKSIYIQYYYDSTSESELNDKVTNAILKKIILPISNKVH